METTLIYIGFGILIAYLSNLGLNDDSRVTSIVSGLLLPISIMCIFIVNIFFDPIEFIFTDLIYLLINISLSMSIYYLVLILFLKHLRNKFNPILVSSLWAMPNFLYYTVLFRHDSIIENKIMISLNQSMITYILIVWLIVGLFSICFKMVEHIQYRNYILEDASEINNQNILNIFELEKDDKYISSKLKLMKTNKIKSPLTIGIIKPVLLLPDLEYSDDELRLVLRHEIIHIVRQDAATKFFMVFCNALCWFNPFIWFANKKCSEDIELSCDAYVLRKENEINRKKYAKLILKNANSEKGFTTCLSANAKSLQYRLNNIIKPIKNTKGTILFAIAYLLLISTFGRIGIAVDSIDYNASDILFKSERIENIELDHYSSSLIIDEYDIIHRVIDKEELYNVLSNLQLDRLTYTFNPKNLEYQTIKYKINNNNYKINIYENNVLEFIETTPEYKKSVYKINELKLDHLIETYPSLNFHLYSHNLSLGQKEYVYLSEMKINHEIIYEYELVETNLNQFGFTPKQYKLVFSDENIKDFEVTINDEITPVVDNIIEAKQGLYKVKITYTKNNNVYEATYRLNIK